MNGEPLPRPCYIPPFVEPTMGHVDVTPFRQVISDWFDQREITEKNQPVDSDDYPADDLVANRLYSFLGRVKPVRVMLKSMGKQDTFDEAIQMWIEIDIRHMEGRLPREQRAHSFYLLIEDYFAGQGFKTRS